MSLYSTCPCGIPDGSPEEHLRTDCPLYGTGPATMTDLLCLPAPRRHRQRFIVPVPLYGKCANLLLPVNMTEQEAKKIANVVLAYAKLTSFNDGLDKP